MSLNKFLIQSVYYYEIELSVLKEAVRWCLK